ncbi:O-antigen ligase family protein [Caulobacter sp.]|uniref:O-antigen ligase family protein n=1 Tax=Caulobacter sp. TaxID=78 RepID=UPI003BAA0301
MRSSAGPERSTTWLGGVAVFTIVLTPFVAYLAPNGFAPLLTLAGLLCLPALARSRPGSPPMMALFVLVMWALISLVWSPAAPHVADLKKYEDLEGVTALKLLFQLAFYGSAVAALGQLSERSKARAGTVMVVCVLALALLVALDGISAAAFYRWLRVLIHDPERPDLAIVKVSMPTYALALLFWPAARIMSSRGWTPAVFVLLAATVIAAFSTSADASWTALTLGAFAWLSVRYLGKPAARVLVAAVAAPFVLGPVLLLWGVHSGFVAWLHRHVPRSWDMRLDIWAFTANQVQQHAIRGWGIDASRTFGPAIPLHTHNAAMQLWLELGAVGAAIGGVFFSWVAYRIVAVTGASRRDGAMAAGALITYVVIGGVSFGVWQEWWLALGALAVIGCGFALGLKSPTPSRQGEFSRSR